MEGMARRFQRLVFYFILFSCATAWTQDIEKLRFSMWAQLEAYPGTEESLYVKDDVFLYPISRLKATAPFFVEGMVCGWSFRYTPSDVVRGVAEEFEFQPLYPLEGLNENISFKEPWLQDNRLYCWVEYECSPQITAWRKHWQSSNYKKISGKGEGLLVDGFDGIYNAAQVALKNAVKDYARTITKNKPRVIEGEVIIQKSPIIGIKSGRYIVELDFFLNISKIKWYNAY